MVFSSPVFLFLFLPFILGAYFVVPRRLRNTLLLVASLFFYVWGEKLYVLVLLSSIVLNYGLGLWIDRVRGPRAAGLAIALAVFVNLGLLGTFKYANFLSDNLNLLLFRLHLPLLQLPPVHLPLGISFFTFHALSYVIDVYRREVPALKNPVNFALYISFFPQSIAGPIVRYNDVAKQLIYRVVTLEGFAEGVRRFIMGLAKKMIVANTLAVPADAIFGLPTRELNLGLSWLGVVCYTLQIYFDFSGYSDMAIGLAKMFGFQFRENFNYPYIAASVTEFWRRWHISLSTWYRDYLYIPLGGNRYGTGRTYFNLVTVFFLCGLWHGASWTFIFWGLFHGSFLVIERMGLGAVLERAWAPVRHLYALLVVMVGWVFFKAATLKQALAFLGAMIGLGRGLGIKYSPSLYLNVQVIGVLVAGVVASLPLLPLLTSLRDRLTAADGGRRSWRALLLEPVFAFTPVAALGFLLLVSAMLMAANTYNPFIYFRF
jgi:alginate O-acetyltransferase complex protein AlgI